ncbi:MAG: hypothetical protein ACO33A_09615 [Hyphomonas sp.]
MSMRAVKSVTPFDFRADFGPQLEEAATGPTRVSFTGEEIAALMTRVRIQTLAEAAKMRTENEIERLAAVTAELTRALDEIAEVMRLIASSQYEASTETRLRGLIDGAAARIVSGQGDLFAVTGRARRERDD